MNVYKFGGASVKDADGVRNLLRVLKSEQQKDLLIVVSAMGKMTNALEVVVDNYFHDKESLEASIAGIFDYHKAIMDELFDNPSHEIYDLLQRRVEEMRAFLLTNKSSNHAFVYDQIVCFGELLSTAIISAFLAESGVENTQEPRLNSSTPLAGG